MPFGAELLSAGGARFRLWAPAQPRIALQLGDAPAVPMRSEGEWHVLESAEAHPGVRYRFVLPDGRCVADPASRFQPEDVHGASELIDPRSYRWRDERWRGVPGNELVIYELHVGAFTARGTFTAAIERLAHLAELGVTALELMPVADFPGRRNWGYDGVLWFAPDSSYGRPDELRTLIDAAHRRGIAVLLDVVYNHFGPEGNYLSWYAPQFFSTRHRTPWGAAVNFDGPGSRAVREFVIHNALYWLEEFHLDGLRLDAVHAIVDDSPTHILEELAQRVRAAAFDRTVHLLLENEHNETRWLERDAHGAPRLYEAQWNDDVHHALHVAVTGDAQGYYAEYLSDGVKLGRAIAEGFAFQGETMAYRGSARGQPSAHLPPGAFIAFLQNHDQVGNRAFGERLGALADAAALRAVSALYLLLPQIPMLFMGEEWDCTHPFQFFCDFGGELAEAVRAGRRAEFARFPAFADPQLRARIPDPQAEGTFLASKPDWHQLTQAAGMESLQRYRALLRTRRRAIAPLMPQLRSAGRFELLGPLALQVAWRSAWGTQLTLQANLKADPQAGFPRPPGRTLWREGESDRHGLLGPWALRWTLSRPRNARAG